MTTPTGKPCTCSQMGKPCRGADGLGAGWYCAGALVLATPAPAAPSPAAGPDGEEWYTGEIVDGLTSIYAEREHPCDEPGGCDCPDLEPIARDVPMAVAEMICEYRRVALHAAPAAQQAPAVQQGWREDGDHLYYCPRPGAAWELAATREHGAEWEAAPGCERLVKARDGRNTCVVCERQCIAVARAPAPAAEHLKELRAARIAYYYLARAIGYPGDMVRPDHEAILRHAEGLQGKWGEPLCPAPAAEPPGDVRALAREVLDLTDDGRYLTAISDHISDCYAALERSVTLARAVLAGDAAAEPPGDVRALAREVLRLDELATAAPWKIEREEIGDHFSYEEQESAFPATIGPICSWEPVNGDPPLVEADAALIAHYRTAAPALARAVLVGDAESPGLREAARELLEARDVLDVAARTHQVTLYVADCTAAEKDAAGKTRSAASKRVSAAWAALRSALAPKGQP